MKCPKCGSENIVRYEKGVNIDTCEDCNTIIQFYNKRLNKVLEKFDEVNEYDIDQHCEISYTKERGFILWTYSKDQTISLDTVEHLIPDMEAQNE